jgi:hypothetical protein
MILCEISTKCLTSFGVITYQFFQRDVEATNRLAQNLQDHETSWFCIFTVATLSDLDKVFGPPTFGEDCMHCTQVTNYAL